MIPGEHVAPTRRCLAIWPPALGGLLAQTLKRLLFLSAATLLSLGAVAQRAATVEATPAGSAWQTRTHAVSAQAGFGWFALADDIDLEITDERGTRAYRAKVGSTPALTVAYDYRFGRVFSLGGAIGHQSLSFYDFQRFSREGEAPSVDILTGSARVHRTFVSARTLFHYGRAANVEFYSGVRLGATVWTAKGRGDVDGDELGIEGVDQRGSFVLPHVNLIPFGVKGYVSPKVYLGAELMTGSPHVVAAQVGYRL